MEDLTVSYRMLLSDRLQEDMSSLPIKKRRDETIKGQFKSGSFKA